MNDELKQQYKLRITSANKTQLVVILYEMFLQYMEEAKEAHEKEDVKAFKDAIRYARGCVKELMQSLNFEYEPAKELMQLYVYVNKEKLSRKLRAYGNARALPEPRRH